MNRRELAPYTIGVIGVLVGTTIGCNEAKRAQEVQKNVEQLYRAQLLQQEILCQKLLPDYPISRLRCVELLEKEYQKTK